jgi:hypothetical protein
VPLLLETIVKESKINARKNTRENRPQSLIDTEKTIKEVTEGNMK